jgi:hypothetical protein
MPNTEHVILVSSPNCSPQLSRWERLRKRKKEIIRNIKPCRLLSSRSEYPFQKHSSLYILCSWKTSLNKTRRIQLRHISGHKFRILCDLSYPVSSRNGVSGRHYTAWWLQSICTVHTLIIKVDLLTLCLLNGAFSTTYVVQTHTGVISEGCSTV